MDWLKKLLGGSTPNTEHQHARIELDGMYIAPASHSQGRAEAALPGTSAVKPLVRLEPPPVDPALVVYGLEEDDDEGDYEPDRIAEFVLSSDAARVFAPRALGLDITPDLRKSFRHPHFFVKTPAGRTTFLVSADSPNEGVTLIAAWPFREQPQYQVDEIAAGAAELAKWLANRSEGFTPWDVQIDAIKERYAEARKILAIEPHEISMLVLPRDEGRFDGRSVWQALHAVGFKWGDGDQFHWNDPTGQTDYLCSADVDDGDFGYALPEEIAAGRQHFHAIRFNFHVLRTPHPAHVLRQMHIAARAAAEELEGSLTLYVDDVAAQGIETLAAAVDGVISELGSLGLKPASPTVLVLT